MNPDRGNKWWGMLCAAAVAIGAATTVRAIDDATLEIDSAAGEGWNARNIAIRLDLNPAGTRAQVRIARLRLARNAYELLDLRIECPGVDLDAPTLSCRDARIKVTVPRLGRQTLRGAVLYRRDTGALDVRLTGLRLGDGTAQLHASLREGRWRAQIEARDAPLESLIAVAKDWKIPLPPLSMTGAITLSLDARGAAGGLRQAQFRATLAGFTANNEAGSVATDQLDAQIGGTVRREGRDWMFNADVRSGSGQAYAQPVFLDLGVHALALQISGRWLDSGALQIDRFRFDHDRVAHATGSAQLDFAAERPLRALALDLAELRFPGAYTSYFQPLLLDTSFKSLATEGTIAGRIDIVAGQPQRIDLRFDSVTLDDGTGAFGLSSLDGVWHWREAAAQTDEQDDEEVAPVTAAFESRLRWRDGALLGLQLGASELRFATTGRQFRLLEAARIPVFDGALDLETFRIRNVGSPKVAFLIDATIVPISVRQLCRAFGWPEFGGSIGGVISKLRMRDGVVTLGTKLQAQVFNGSVSISDLRLEDPLGKWPRFQSNIALDNLDLELVTSAFSFGRITGRLSGAIDGLELFNWTPIAFDARLFTPPGDRSRHRISQRAVENIGSIGGGGAGITAALSSGFLRFFDDFNYDRLGLSCRLENEVCHMNGVAPAPNGGYYLVKGRGLPRIDVVGGARRVDWPRLVQQLIAMTKSEGPVVR